MQASAHQEKHFQQSIQYDMLLKMEKKQFIPLLLRHFLIKNLKNLQKNFPKLMWVF